MSSLLILLSLSAFASPDGPVAIPETDTPPDAPPLLPVAEVLTAPTPAEATPDPADAAPSRAEDPRLAGLSHDDLVAARTLLDDRASVEKRQQAVRDLATVPDSTWLLRAAARDRIEALQHAVIEAASANPSGEALSLLAWVTADTESTHDVRAAALRAIASQPGDAAGDALWALASDRDVPAALRSRARSALHTHHAGLLALRGAPRPVTDLLGGASFVGAWGLGGGVGLAAIGQWGRFEGGAAIGAVGGTAIGLGTSGYAVSRVPLTAGQGLAQLSGTGWGLTAAQWASDASLGRRGSWWLQQPPVLEPDATLQDRNTVETWQPWQPNVAAGFRLAGVGIGSALGTHWMIREPDAWDVMEVNLATYLGSAMALSGAALTSWHPDRVGELADHGAWEDAQRVRFRQQRILDASNLGGAALGLGAGLALKDHWQLDPEDAAFAMVLGLEAAWVGQWAPAALGSQRRDMKGNVRLPWNAAIAGGLLIAELHPMSLETSAVTAVTAGAGNAIGAGIPLLARRSDDATVSRVMLPLGLAGAAGGVIGAPWFAPDGGDWAMTSLTTGMSAYNFAAVAAAADLRSEQAGGLVLVGTGAASLAGLTAGHLVTPRPDDMLTLASAAAWGSFYGALAPIAAGDRLDGRWRPLVAAGAADAFLGGTAIALSRRVGLRPGHTVIPQLLGLSGATAGAIGTGLVTSEGESVAAGALIGASVGLIGGGTLVALAPPPRRQVAQLPNLRVPGHWQPVLSPTVVDGEAGVYVGLNGVGW